MTDLKVGDRVPNREAFDALPVGTAVTTKDSIKLTTRHPQGWSNHNDMGNYFGSDRYWYEGCEIVSLPTSVYSGPMIGVVIESLEQVEALARGTVLAKMDDPEYEIRAQCTEPDRWFHTADGYPRNDRYVWETFCSVNKYVVNSLPVDLFETVEQFAWRFRDLALTGNERARGTANDALRILERMKVEFRPSVGMRITSRYDRDNILQEGMRVYVGNPDLPDTFALWEYKGTMWVRLFGSKDAPLPRDAVACVIDAMPDGRVEPDEWFVKPASPEDAGLIALLRAKAWNLGYAEKVSKGWCDEFERVMLRGGLTAESANLPLPGNARIGEPVTIRQAHLQEVGAIFRVNREDGTLLALFQRSSKSKNRAGTVRVWAAEDWQGGNFDSHMTLVNVGQEGQAIAQLGSLTGKPWNEELREMPLGTRIVSGPQITGRGYQKVIDYDPTEPYYWADCGLPPFSEPGPDGAVYNNEAFGRGWYYARVGGPQ